VPLSALEYPLESLSTLIPWPTWQPWQVSLVNDLDLFVIDPLQRRWCWRARTCACVRVMCVFDVVCDVCVCVCECVC
jgi:hypothetical protein